ncbi:MAG: adhesin [Pseudonocardiales bacterium]|nr:adhesin [Pseudonocardiales bacterium]
MLAITENAALAINTLMSEMPAGAGLRIAPAQEPQTLALSAAPAPSPQDTVLESAGATLFLEPSAAQALNDQVLDAQQVVSDDGYQYHFAIAPQAAG